MFLSSISRFCRKVTVICKEWSNRNEYKNGIGRVRSDTSDGTNEIYTLWIFFLFEKMMRDLYAKKEKYYLLCHRGRSWKRFSLVDSVVSSITLTKERWIWAIRHPNVRILFEGVESNTENPALGNSACSLDCKEGHIKKK